MGKMIFIFNTITSSLVELPEVYDMIDNHFEKYRYFYKFIGEIDLSILSNVTLLVSDIGITIEMVGSDLDDIWEELNCNLDCDFRFKKFFSLVLNRTDESVLITIENLNIPNEKSVYQQ